MSGLIIWALGTLCGTTTGLDYQPSYRPEKKLYRLGKTVEIAKEKLSWSGMDITETVFDRKYAGAYGIKFSGDYYQDTFFLAIDPVSMSYVRIWKSNVKCLEKN